MRSTNYLEFLGAQVPVHISIDMIQTLIFLGLILALLLNFRNIIRMSRQEIVETLEPTETRDPVWKRYSVDSRDQSWYSLSSVCGVPLVVINKFSAR